MKNGSNENKLDRVFSEFIRVRDTDSDGYGTCCTCNKHLYWKDGQAGHFITRDRKATKFDERNVHLQCVRCNYHLKGHQDAHAVFVDKTYGPGTAELLRVKSKLTPRTSEFEYGVMLIEYRKRLKELKERKAWKQ